MPTTLKDYYTLLHLPPTATHDQIKAAYRKHAFLCHPDRGGSPSRMRELNEAWSILGDPQARRAYDTERNLSKPHPIPKRTAQPRTRNQKPCSSAPTNSFLTKALFVPIHAFAFSLGWLISRLSSWRRKLRGRK